MSIVRGRDPYSESTLGGGSERSGASRLGGFHPGIVRMRWPLWLDLILLGTTGGIQAASYGAEGLWWLQCVAVGVLAWRLSTPGMRPRRAAFLGWLFAVTWLGGAVWWLFISMNTYGGLPAWMAAAAVALLCGFLALYMGAAMGAYVKWRSGHSWRDAVLFAAVWMLAEMARGWVFTGFPWASSGYAHVDGPFSAVAPWVGVYGIGGLVAGWAALVALSVSARPGGRTGWMGLALCAISLLVLSLWGGGYHTQPGPVMQVTLLQPNVAQDKKFTAEQMPATLGWIARALTNTQGDLVVAPETAIPLLPDQLPPDYWNLLQRHFHAARNAALIGVPLGSAETGYTNSVVGLSGLAANLPQGQYRYDKYHLVPFGEFIPQGFHWFTRMMNIPLGDFARGAAVPESFPVATSTGKVRVAPNICYEDLFGEELAVRFRDATTAPGVMANLSNIAWFGNTEAVPQHQQISRMRALEFQRPMIRATNTGATVVIDHLGQVTDHLPPFTRGQIAGFVQARFGLTPYAKWASAWGLLPLAGLGLLLVLLTRRWSPRPEGT